MKLASVRALTCAAGSSLVLAACGASGLAADEGVRTLRVSHFMEATHPHETCGMAEIKKRLEGSSLTIETYPAAQLGGEWQSLEQVFTGSLDMSINGPSFLGVYYEPFHVLDAGYLFDDVDAFLEFQDSDIMRDLLEGIEQEWGFKVFPAWYYGIRHVTADKPITGPEDLRGVKLRTPDAPIYKTNLGAMGATVSPLPLSELYMALQQGVVDAQENPTTIIDTMKLYEVQSDLSLTGHMVQGLHVSVSQGVWDTLNPEEQDLLSDAILAGGEAATRCVLDVENDFLTQFEEGGLMQVHEVDTTVFKERVRARLSEGQHFSDEYRQIIESQEAS